MRWVGGSLPLSAPHGVWLRAAGKLPPSGSRLYHQAVKASDYNNAFRINHESHIISHYSRVRT